MTRKGAIRARQGDKGIIAGSMGTSTFVVEGLGNPDSYQSAAHGAAATSRADRPVSKATSRSSRRP